MNTRRASTGLALVAGASLTLAACTGDGGSERLTPAPETPAASASTLPPRHPVAADPDDYAVDGGGHLFTLPDGGICSVGGELNDLVDSDFACLLTLDEPTTAENGEPTSGVEYRDAMFAPSAALADPQVRKAFSDADAEPLGPQSELTVGGFGIVVETPNEYGFVGAEGGDFFVAAGQLTPFWTPRPDWVPEPGFPTADRPAD